MTLESDITINVPKFDPASVPKATTEGNENLMKMMASGPKWFEVCAHNEELVFQSKVQQVGAAKYRHMRWNNETPLPRPPVVESGVNFTVPSRNSGREIPCRKFQPEKGESNGAFMHIHGGGFVLNSEALYVSRLFRASSESSRSETTLKSFM